MDQEKFEVLKERIEKTVTFSDFLEEKHRFKMIIAVYLISFSLIYLIVNKEYAIIVSASIAVTLLFSTYFERKKSPNLFHSIFGYIVFIIIVSILSFTIIYILNLFPNQAAIAYAIIVCLSVLFGFISGIRLLYISLPTTNKFLGTISTKLLFFAVISISWLILIFKNTSIDTLITSFNLLKNNEELIISRISTSATVLTFGLFILNLIRNTIIEEKLNNNIRLYSRLNHFINPSPEEK